MFNISKFYFKFDINHYLKSIFFDYNYSLGIYQLTITLDSKTLISNSFIKGFVTLWENIFLSTPNI